MAASYMLAEYCTDGLCTSRTQFEPDGVKGTFQTSGFVMRTYGYFVGGALGAVLYNTSEWGWGLSISQIFLLNGLVPLFTVVPLLWSVEEISDPTQSVPTLFSQLEDLWSENFSDFELGLTVVTMAFCFYLGAASYNSYFAESDWRQLYLVTSITRFVFTLLQVVLVLQWNDLIGVPNIVFALLDSAVIFFTWGLLNSPPFTMYVIMCPPHLKRSDTLLYSLYNTIYNISWVVSCDLSIALSTLWDVSNGTIQAGDFNGVLGSTVLTSLIQLYGIVFIGLLPQSK
eukprot:gene29596-36671_t